MSAVSAVSVPATKKELTEKLKGLRAEHSGKTISKMTPEEMSREIEHHETACRARELKAKRMEALAKAREAKKSDKAKSGESKSGESKSDTISSRKEH